MKIAIYTISDDKFAQGTYTLWKSIRKYTNTDKIDFKILTEDQVELDNYKDFIVPHRNLLKSFYKFELLKNREYDRIIFIDSDIVCLGDISRLFAPSPSAMMVVEDRATTKWFRNRYEDSNAMWKMPFNAGMIVLNRPMFNDDYYTTVLNYAKDGKHSRISDWNDQGIWNSLVEDKQIDIEILPREYNVLKRYIVYEPDYISKDKIKLLHFTGPKPWMGGEFGFKELEDLWHKENKT